MGLAAADRIRGLSGPCCDAAISRWNHGGCGEMVSALSRRTGEASVWIDGPPLSCRTNKRSAPDELSAAAKRPPGFILAVSRRRRTGVSFFCDESPMAHPYQ